MGYIPFPGRKVAALRGVQQIICLQIGRFLDPKRVLVSQSYSASKMSLPPPFFFFVKGKTLNIFQTVLLQLCICRPHNIPAVLLKALKNVAARGGVFRGIPLRSGPC